MTAPDPLAPERFRDELVALARFQLFAWAGPKLDASDVVQDALLRAHAARGEFRGTTEVEMRAWLRAILGRTLANVVRDFRRDKRDVRRERPLEAALDASGGRLDAWLAASQTSPSAGAGRAELLDRLAAAVAALPDDQRRVVLLKHAEGLSANAIATRLGATVPAVAGLLRRGLRTLRDLLDGEDRP